MPNILSRGRDRSEEPYDRPNLMLQLTYADSIASDATARNNLGPGRIVGLLFDTNGGRLERFLNERAGRYTLGPLAIVEDIRNLRHHEKSSWFGQHKIPQTAASHREYRLLKKRCRQLLKYCRSHLLSTQLEALEAVTALAVEDSFVRQVLAGVLHHSYLIQKHNETELCIGSFKAVISVKENEVYDFVSQLEKASSCKDFAEGQREVGRLINRLEYFLKNPDISFLLARLLRLRFHNFLEHLIIYDTYITTASMNPRVIEWEILREIFTVVIRNMSQPSVGRERTLRLAHSFPILQLYHAGTLSRQKLIHRKETPFDYNLLSENSFLIVPFLDHFCGSEDVTVQIRYLGKLQRNMRDLFNGTAFANEILIAFAHAHRICRKWYPTLTQPMLTRLQASIKILVNSLRCGNPGQQTLAKDAIKHLLASNPGRYFKLAVSRCGAAFNTSPSLTPFITQRFPICRRDFLNNLQCGVSTGSTDEEDLLYYPEGLCYWLAVNISGDEDSFNVIGHFPILAGFNTSGEEIYVAIVERGYTYVSDGARGVSVQNSDGGTTIFNRFYVLVLRHDPSDVRVEGIPEGAKFQTGPAYWVQDEEAFRAYKRRKEFSWETFGSVLLEGFFTFWEEVGGWSNSDALGVSQGKALEVEDRGVLYLGETVESATNAPETFERTATQEDTEAVAGFVEKDFLTDVEAQEGDGLARLRRKCKFIEEERSQLISEQRALEDRMRTLEDRERELEFEELRIVKCSNPDRN